MALAKQTAFPTLGLALLLIICGCDAWTQAQGTIRDTSGKPVPDAVVTMKIGDETKEMHSVEDGRFLISLGQAPFREDVILNVSKPGYESVEKKLKGPGIYKGIDIVLEPVPQSPTDPFENIAKTMFPNAKDIPRNIGCFRSLSPEMSIYAVVEKCGRPDGEFGSGIYIFAWHMPDGASVSINTSNLDRIGDVRLADKSGKTSSLLQKK